MSLLAPVARPAFSWNHGQLMREMAESLARRLGADLAVPDTPARPYRPAGSAWWVVVGAALAAVAVLGWRRHASRR